MLQTYSQQRKLAGGDVFKHTTAPGSSQAIPNSAILSIRSSRLPRVQQRVQAQIPAAEQEASRLSASITSGSPDAVKSIMGRRLGADFSAVRFHTGEDAAARARAMDARAYTSGADIYFGEQGFDPAVAAHELVHTAQQGMVASSMPILSTPAGGVQRFSFRSLFGKKSDPPKPKEEPDYQDMENKARDYLAKNHSTFMNKSGSFIPDQTKSVTILQDNDTQPQQDAGTASPQASPPPSSSETYQLPQADPYRLGPDEQDGSSGDPPEFVDTAATVGDFAGSSAGAANSGLENYLSGWKNSKFNDGLTYAADAIGAVTGIYHGIQDVRGAMKAHREHNDSERRNNIISALGNFSSASSSVLDIAKGITDKAILKPFTFGTGLVSNAASIAQGGLQYAKGQKQANGMNEFLKTFEPSSQGDPASEIDRSKISLSSSKEATAERARLRATLTSPRDRLLWDAAVMGKMHGTQLRIEGAGNMVTGALDAVGSITELAAQPHVSFGAKLLSLASKAAFFFGGQHHQKKMKKKVLAQTTGITDEVIKEFQKTNQIEKFKDAKHALLRSLGYKSGKRGELVADQLDKRAQKIVAMANEGDPKAQLFIKSMGIDSDTDTATAASLLAAGMGQTKKRSDYAKYYEASPAASV